MNRSGSRLWTQVSFAVARLAFSGHTGTEVRVKLLENEASEMTFYERRSAVCLQMRSINFETWVETIADEHVFCDELALMGLSYMYHRHCVVLTQSKLVHCSS